MQFCVAWEFVEQGAAIKFTMSSEYSTGYVSLGFGDAYGVMSPADMYVGWIDVNGVAVLSDRYLAHGYDNPTIDSTQDGTLISAEVIEGRLTVVFTRAVNTGDTSTMDREISSIDGNNFIWSTHDITPLSVNGKLQTHSTSDRGFSKINFFTGEAIASKSAGLPKYVYVSIFQ